MNYPDGTRITNKAVIIGTDNTETDPDELDSDHVNTNDVSITHFLTIPNLDGNKYDTTDSVSSYAAIMRNKEFSNEGHIKNSHNQTNLLNTIVTPNIKKHNTATTYFQTKSNTVNKHEEPFEIVGINSCMEHSNYATVEFNDDTKQVTISLPDNITITTNDGKTYSIQVDQKTTIQLSQNNIIFNSKLNNILQSNSTKFNFYKYKDNKHEPSFIFRTTDIFGNSFIFDYISIFSNSFKLIKGPFDYKDYFENNLYPKERFFVMKRDITGYEMLKHFSNFLVNSSSSCIIPRSSVTTEHQFEIKEIGDLYIQTKLTEAFPDKYLMKLQYNHLPTNLKKMHLRESNEKDFIIWFDKNIVYKVTLPHKESTNNFHLVKNNCNFIIRNIKKIKNDNLNVTDAFEKVFYKYLKNCISEYNKYAGNVIADSQPIEERLLSVRLTLNVLKEAMSYWAEEQNQSCHQTLLLTSNQKLLSTEP